MILTKDNNRLLLGRHPVEGFVAQIYHDNMWLAVDPGLSDRVNIFARLVFQGPETYERPRE